MLYRRLLARGACVAEATFYCRFGAIAAADDLTGAFSPDPESAGFCPLELL